MRKREIRVPVVLFQAVEGRRPCMEDDHDRTELCGEMLMMIGSVLGLRCHVDKIKQMLAMHSLGLRMQMLLCPLYAPLSYIPWILPQLFPPVS